MEFYRLQNYYCIVIIRQRTAGVVVVDDVTCTRLNLITRVVIRFFDTTLSTE